MAIIISQNGRNARKVEASHFRNEAHLQEYIHNNPESLPLEEIDEDIRLLILAREFPTQSGPIDALGIDEDGNLYVIETKLYKNPDKRTVVAQVMDYGAALWRWQTGFAEFFDTLDGLSVKQKSKGAVERIRNFYGISDEEVETLKEGIRHNLSEGRFRFVVLMDKLTDRLKDLILFINQNSQFDIYGVELEYYRHDDWEILLPKLFGGEVRKKDAVAGGGRRRWDEGRFFEKAAELLPDSQLAALRRLCAFAKERRNGLAWGSGTTRGSFNMRSPNVRGGVFSAYNDGTLAVVANGMTKEESERFLRTSTLGARTEAGGEWWMEFPIDKWAGKVDTVIQAIGECVDGKPGQVSA
jgi:hypothetical protein